MKKIILGVVLVLLVGGGGTAALVAYQFDSTYGLRLAEQVSHAEVAEGHTRVRGVLDTAQLREYVLNEVGDEIVLPGWLPFDLERMVEEVMPREVALLAGPDWSGGQYRMTLFVNERRGGPFIVQELNKTDIFDQIQWVQWDPPMALLERRGVITARGGIPIPPNAEMRVLQHWTHDGAEDLLEIEGGHLLEVTFDNRNGDSLTVFAALLEAFGMDWEDVADNQPMMRNMLNLFPLLYTLRGTADLLNADEASIVLKLHAHDDARPQITFLGNAIILPEYKRMLQNEHGLILEGEIQWDAETNTAIGDFVLRGLEDFIARMTRGGGGTAAPAAGTQEPA